MLDMLERTDPEPRQVTLFLCGDVMTGRGIDQILLCPGTPELGEQHMRSALDYLHLAEQVNGPIPRLVDFAYIWGDALKELDRIKPTCRIVNLETSITTSQQYEPKGINYRMHPANTPCLTASKLDCCVLANNHVLDWGRSGLADTLDALRNAGIRSAGAGRDLTEAWEPAIINVGVRARVLVFAVGTLDSGIPRGWAAADARPGIAVFPDLTDERVFWVADQVARVKQPCDLAVLSIHWGPNWGYGISPQCQQFARKLIDLAGVHVVHGHSSHHPKGIEIYTDRPILYGCGDFLNDYEGIGGYEQFRPHLALAYFPTIDPVTGRLLAMELAPFAVKRFKLRHPGPLDIVWLADMLTRAGKPFGTRVTVEGRGLTLDWDRRPV